MVRAPFLAPALLLLLLPHCGFIAGARQPQAPANHLGLTSRVGLSKSQGVSTLWLLQQGISKRSPVPEPDAEGHTLDLSMTANMDTLRQRLIFALRNRASQGGGRDLEYHG